MSAGKRVGLNGRPVLAVAAVGVALKLFHTALAKPAGIRDELLILDAAWAAGMAAVLGCALASVRRGPVDGRPAAGVALGVCVASVVGVAVELAWYIRHPSWH